MKITDIQGERLAELVTLGYKIRFFHSDGVIDVAKLIDGDVVRVFVTPEGDIRPPRTHSTMLASAELHSAGIRTVSPNADR